MNRFTSLPPKVEKTRTGRTFMRRMLLPLTFLFVMLGMGTAEASHYRYGNIKWTRPNNTSRTVTFTVTQAWRLSAFPGSVVGSVINPGTPLVFGDATPNGNVSLTVTAVDPVNDWLYGTSTIVHTYAGTVTSFTVSYSSCCRIGSPLQNNVGGSFSSQTIVKLVNGSLGSPVSTMPPIINLPVGITAATFSVPATDPDGTTLTYALANTAQFGGTNPSGFAINAASGVATFNTVGKTVGHYYSVGVNITDASGANTVVDFLILIVNPSNPPIYDYTITPSNGFTYNLNPGQPLSFQVKALDNDPGSTVTLSVVGTTTGMTFSPVLPSTANPITTTFNWTPTASQLGVYILNFTAQDNVGIQTQTSVKINVSVNPYFVVPPTPALNSSQFRISGIPFTNTIQATNPTPGVLTRINSATLPSGASVSPSLPTAYAVNPVTTLSWTPAPSHFGPNNITFTALDQDGRTATHTYQVIVNTEPAFTSTPVLTAAACAPYVYNVTASDANIPFGDVVDILASTLPSWLTITSTGNGTATISGTPSAADIGTHLVELDAEDAYHHANPNHIEQSFYIVVADNQAPTAVCQNITVNIGTSGTATVSAAQINNGSSDDCGAVTTAITAGQTTFTCADNGNTYPVTLTVTDGSGNASSCVAQVTVADPNHNCCAAPVAICQNTTIYLDANGAATLSPAQVDGGSTAGCGLASTTVSATSFNCTNVGNNNVTLTVTDINGASATCTAIVSVLDTVRPTITCGSTVSVNADNGSCAATNVALGTPATADNCGVASVSNNAPTSYPVGTTAVTWTVTDVNGNSATCTQDVVVTDNQNPTITCGATVSVNADNGSCAATNVALGTPATADNCGVASVSNNAPTSYAVGTTTVTWTVTDVNGNSATCTQDVVVTDNQNPTITCGSTVSVNADNGSCAATNVALGTPATADNCGVASVSNDAPTSYAVGTTTVTWTVTDVNGNSATCTQDVVVTDNQNPTITCGSTVSVNADNGSCAATNVALGTPATADNCGVASVSNNAPTSYPVGTTTVTWTVTDVNGNSATCTQDVVVTDNQNPTITCGSTVSVNADNGSCSATNVALGTPATADNCGVASVSNNAPNSYAVGTTTVTWTVTDVNGNSATCTQDVVVTDNQNPTITCGSTVSVNADNGSCAATNVALGTPATADNCGVASVSNDAPTSYAVGTTTVTWTVTDVNGNSATCTQDVVVTDNQNPTITCGATVSVNADNGSCAATNVALGTPATADNCGVASVSNNAPTSYAVGTTTVTWTVTDVNGNSATCTQDVVVTDNQNPTITCGSTVSVNADNGSCAATNVALGTPATADNCGVASVSNDAPTSYAVGTTTVTWTVTDVNGNSATCTQDVVVTDNQNPTITCGSTVSVNADNGSCAATNVALGTPATADNCGVASVSNNAPTSYAVGTTTVTWTVTDVNGNSATCTQDVVVTDNQNPTITCGSTVSVNADNGSCAATNVVLGTPATADNCGVASVSNNAPTSYAVGTTTVIWTVTDVNGNSATCTQDVTVTDNQAPVVTCPANINLAACTSTASWTVNAIDNCGIASIVSTPASGSTFNYGTTVVNVVVTDIHGNVSNCSFTVTRANALFAGISSLPVSPIVTCGYGPGANIVIGYGNGPTSLPLNSFVSGGTPAYTYSWFPSSNLSNASSPNPVFTPNLTTGCSNYNYTLTVTDANGCVATQTVTVKVVNVVAQYNPNGSVKKVKMCHITSSATNTEVDIEISVNAVPTHLAHGDCLGDCQDDCDPNARFGHITHDDHYQGGKVDVIPNPNNGSFGLEIVPAIPNTEVTVMIFDLTGKQFFARTYSDVTFIHDDIDLNQINGGVAPGIYLVKVVNDEYVFTKKVTVAK